MTDSGQMTSNGSQPNEQLQSAGWVIQIIPGRTRYAVCALIVIAIILLSLSLWWSVMQGASAGLAFWIAQGLLALVAVHIWRRLRPAACPQWLAVCRGRWQVQRPGADEWLALGQAGTGRRPVILPNLVMLPEGRDWIFADECNPDDWRRLNFCARFSRHQR